MDNSLLDLPQYDVVRSILFPFGTLREQRGYANELIAIDRQQFQVTILDNR